MKIALLSFHNAYNYGAALQAYALQKAVNELGVECEYINYLNEHRRKAYNMKDQVIFALRAKKYVWAMRVLIGTPFILARGKKFQDFYRSNLKYTQKIYSSSDEAAELNSYYDKFIVGSDQVWNTENNGGDTAYLLDFVRDNTKKISFASSFGMISVSDEFRTGYADFLRQIDRLSVREQAGVIIVKQLTGRQAHLVLDPVFLVGVDGWNRLRIHAKQKSEKYVFFYTNSASQVQNFLSVGYSMEKMNIHILSSHVKPSDFLNPHVKVRVSMSPITFLDEIADSELVVTASFHCLAFAILFHKQFCVILTGNRGKDERLLNLLEITGLESRILRSDTTVEDILRPIDYAQVDQLLKPYLNYSKEYLKRAVFSEPDVAFLNEKIHDEKNTSFFCSDERCTGCTACVNICPVKAINMAPDSEGFNKPERDKTVCISCGKCHDVCQVFKKPENRGGEQKYYAVKNIDEVRKKSASGGVFSAVSDVILKKGGVIAAASMDQLFTVSHSIADNAADRDKMLGAFYVQSDLGDNYTKIRDLLLQNTPVLFVGTPCQVQGLYQYLGDVTEGLYTCDLVCHGVPSPGVFKQYIEFLKERGKITEYRFRNKSMGWKNTYTVSCSINGKKYQNTLWLQSYLKMFSKSMINRMSCANCIYASYERVGDLTIGDFWGIERSKPEFKDGLGVSLVLCNTQKGKELLDSTSGLTVAEVDRKDTVQNSLMHASEPASARPQVFRMIKEKGYEETARQYGDMNVKGFLKEVLRRILFETMNNK